MSRYDGLIIPRSYSEYLNKTDSATLSQMLQHLTGLWSHAVSSGDNKPVISDAVYEALTNYINKTDADTLQQALQLPGVLSGAVADGDNKAVTSNAVNSALSNFNLYSYHSKRSGAKFDELQANNAARFYIQLIDSNSEGTFPQGATSGVILTYTWDGPYATQIFIEEDVNRRIYIRYNDHGTPGNWKQLAFIE